jgi:hypothetical protein
MKWPATSDEMKAAGYVYDNDAACRGCGEPIEWWITPKGKKMPIRVKRTATIQHATADVREPHFTIQITLPIKMDRPNSEPVLTDFLCTLDPQSQQFVEGMMQ